MPSLKGVTGLRVPENGGGIKRFPAGHGFMTGVTGSLEAAPMWIAVAGGAVFKRNAGKLDLGLCTIGGSMALVACNLFVCFVECKACPTMVEAGRFFPILRVVAARTLRRQLTMMYIFVTGRTVRGKSQKGTVQAFNHNAFSCRFRNPGDMSCRPPAPACPPTHIRSACDQTAQLKGSNGSGQSSAHSGPDGIWRNFFRIHPFPQG
jgi:hypothetical protein